MSTVGKPRMDPSAFSPHAAEGRRPLVAIIADTAQAYDREIVAGAAQYGREAGDWELYFEEPAADRVPDYQAWNGSGVIVTAGNVAPAAAVGQAGLPVVIVGGTPCDVDGLTGIPRITTDNLRIGSLGAEHLLDRSLTSFGYYGPPAAPATDWAELRGRAFRERIARAGRPCDVLEAKHSATDWAKLKAELMDWLMGLPRPLGVMACDDRHARHLLEACRSAGLRVPHDVAVIGVDDDELVCEMSIPRLTSIAQSTRRIGYEAARLLDQLMRPERHGAAADFKPPIHTVIPPIRVVTRASTDTVAVEDELVSWAVAMIREQACQGLTAQRLAELAGVSRWMIERRFRALVGHSIHDDIARIRLGEAERLVRTTQLSMKEVAARSGFHSVSYLTTAFRRKLGTTPALLRHLEQGRLAGGADDGAAGPRRPKRSAQPAPVLRFGELSVRRLADRQALGEAAAADIAACLRRILAGGRSPRVIFAAAPSQNEMLAGLVAAEGIEWSRITAFHMDEYIGLPAHARQRFARFLDERLYRQVHPNAIHVIGELTDPEAECRRYATLLKEAPIDVVCLGIGENGHIAFNDPPLADFADPRTMRVVELDEVSRRQQVHDGCFRQLSEVPRRALTLTIPTLLSGRHLFCSVPGATKRAAVERALYGPIDPTCPASILRTHPDCTLYVDADSWPG